MSSRQNINHRFNHKKYRAFTPIQKPNRRWPDKQITQAPLWCSVDLRDGNQALNEPMNPAQKLKMFKLLLETGFKQIEVGFPAASQTDFDFVRQLIEQQLIPDDVSIQVLTQARESLITRTFEAVKGAHSVIIHLYNSTSTIQRQQVFNKNREEIKSIATQGAVWVKQHADKQPDTQWQFQYSPESFTATEIDYAAEVCSAVVDIWQPTEQQKVILNLPATVEVATPNVYADQIEWFVDNISQRNCVTISLHTHNDRGCGVAAAELGVMAGADRIEGTLLGNGERTGNMDIVTMAMNLYSQGVNPQLNLANMDKIISVVESCTQLSVHPRHPYAGELVFAAFSGSHQDAINKCLAIDEKKRALDPNAHWQVAYLPIDPKDLGRSYQQVIRINSQSGKGGVAYILEQEHGVKIPRWLQVDFSPHIQRQAEQTEGEVSSEIIWEIFQQTYLRLENLMQVNNYTLNRSDRSDVLDINIQVGDTSVSMSSQGKGVLDAFIIALNENTNADILLIDYSEHALPGIAKAKNEQANAMAYVQLSINNQRYAGVGISNDIVGASLNAVLNGLSRSGVILNSANKANLTTV
ncbi:2-isopropylmalate synthase [Aliikangiella sp. IMCC44359]|uniref:2-isopropylmalate synthase n=1 Tax=Aliikangiella sp. IMCC44359 TaxID=3459125 RepID=UPI00403AECE2